MDITGLPEARYGFATLRYLHLIHHLRWNNPNERILCKKIDVEKAYCWLHTRAQIAAKCIAVWFLDSMWTGTQAPDHDVAVALRRFPFGSSPAPSNFSITSEPVFDLAGDLLLCNLWEPTDLPSPYVHRISAPQRLPAHIPFGIAEEADIKLDQACKGRTDGYIYNGACAILDSANNWRMVLRAAQAVLMAFSLIFHPLAGSTEPISRPDPTSIRKLKAKRGLAEIVIFLGWLIDTQRLLISIPLTKWTTWSTQINLCLTRASISGKELSSLIGHLNHVSFIIPDARHFMNHLRAMVKIATLNAKPIALSTSTKDNLRL